MEEQAIEERVKRGWFWGTEGFKEAMLDLYRKGREARGTEGNRVHQSSGMMHDYSENGCGGDYRGSLQSL